MNDLVSQLVGALERLSGQCERMRLPGQSMSDAEKNAIAALTAAKAGGWQGMESAPKDGSLFLCWVEAVRYGETDEGQQYQEDVSQVDFCQWLANADAPDGGWFDPCCGQIGDAQHVKAWQPLPNPPKEQA